MSEEPKVKRGKIADYRPLQSNPNVHTQRGLRELEKSVQEDGWVAPLTVAADGESLDGAARLEVAADKFDGDVLVVEHDGTRPVVMVRTDIPDSTTPHAKRIIYRANRIAELDLAWNPEQMALDLEAGLDLSGLWTDLELAQELESQYPDAPEDFPEYDDDIETEYKCPKCGYEWSGSSN